MEALSRRPVSADPAIVLELEQGGYSRSMSYAAKFESKFEHLGAKRMDDYFHIVHDVEKVVMAAISGRP